MALFYDIYRRADKSFLGAAESFSLAVRHGERFQQNVDIVDRASQELIAVIVNGKLCIRKGYEALMRAPHMAAPASRVISSVPVETKKASKLTATRKTSVVRKK